MEEIKLFVGFLLSLLGISIEDLDPTKMLTDKVSTIFVTASNALYGNNSVLKNGTGTNIMKLMIPIGIVIGVIYWLISMMDKVDSEKFTLEILIRNFMKLILGLIIITNCFSIAYKFDEFTNDIITDLEGISSVNQGEDNNEEKEKKMAAEAQRKYQRMSTSDLTEDSFDDDETEDSSSSSSSGASSTSKVSYDSSKYSSVTMVPASSSYASTFESGYDDTKMTLRAQIIAGKLRDQGFSDACICGILGNLTTESGLSPSAGNQIGHGHYGLAQWDPVYWRDFTSHYKAPTAQADSNFEAQVSYLIETVNTIMAPVKDTNDPIYACEYWMVHYENCCGGSESCLNTDISNRSVWEGASSRRGYTLYWCENFGIAAGTGLNGKPYLKDIFTNSMSTEEATNSAIEILLIAIISLVITFCIYGVAYSRAIKIFYMLIFSPFAVGKLFASSKPSQGVMTYYKQLLAAFMVYPAMYLICKFYTLIIETVTASDGAVTAMIGIFIISIVAMVKSVKDLSGALENLLR